MSAREKLTGLEVELFVDEVAEEFVCPICLGGIYAIVFRDPCDSPCGCTFCKQCIKSWLWRSSTCPTDRKPLTSRDLKSTHRLFKSLMSRLRLRCPNHEKGCKELLTLDALSSHESSCKYHPKTSSSPNTANTIRARDVTNSSSLPPQAEGNRHSQPSGVTRQVMNLFGRMIESVRGSPPSDAAAASTQQAADREREETEQEEEGVRFTLRSPASSDDEEEEVPVRRAFAWPSPSASDSSPSAYRRSSDSGINPVFVPANVLPRRPSSQVYRPEVVGLSPGAPSFGAAASSRSRSSSSASSSSSSSSNPEVVDPLEGFNPTQPRVEAAEPLPLFGGRPSDSTRSSVSSSSFPSSSSSHPRRRILRAHRPLVPQGPGDGNSSSSSIGISSSTAPPIRELYNQQQQQQFQNDNGSGSSSSSSSTAAATTTTSSSSSTTRTTQATSTATTTSFPAFPLSTAAAAQATSTTTSSFPSFPLSTAAATQATSTTTSTTTTTPSSSSTATIHPPTSRSSAQLNPTAAPFNPFCHPPINGNNPSLCPYFQARAAATSTTTSPQVNSNSSNNNSNSNSGNSYSSSSSSSSSSNTSRNYTTSGSSSSSTTTTSSSSSNNNNSSSSNSGNNHSSNLPQPPFFHPASFSVPTSLPTTNLSIPTTNATTTSRRQSSNTPLMPTFTFGVTSQPAPAPAFDRVRFPIRREAAPSTSSFSSANEVSSQTINHAATSTATTMPPAPTFIFGSA